MKLMKVFELNVRNLMKAQMINQRELAKKTEISEVALSRYLSGERVPKITTVRSIADALGTTIGQLCTENSDPCMCKNQLNTKESSNKLLIESLNVIQQIPKIIANLENEAKNSKENQARAQAYQEASAIVKSLLS